MVKLYNYLKYLCFFSFVLSSGFCMQAGLTDNEGMPIVYLKGTVTDWKPAEEYKFQRNGSEYSLSITNDNYLEGEFKIADDDWTGFDFGASKDGLQLSGSGTLVLEPGGENIGIEGKVTDGKIVFYYSKGDKNIIISYNFDGGEVPPITPSNPWSGTLPVMYINVYQDEAHSSLNNEIIDYNLSHKDYFDYAEYWLDLNGCEWLEALKAESVGSKEKPLKLQIKARGNYTRWGFSKKPFKLKLDKKQNLLGLTPDKSKHYALLAHADDTFGYLRNFTSFNLGQRIGLPWTPGMQPVEVVINGDYRGLYFLTESIRVGDGRINIRELDDNVSDPKLVSGGYVVELDNYDEVNQISMEEKAAPGVNHQLDILRITFDTPEVYSDLQRRFVTEQFSAMNDAVGAKSDVLWRYMDLDDAARYYLVNEIIGHTESYHGSTYMFRNHGDGQKWHFSPLWDAGNAFNAYENGFFYDNDPFGNTWIPSMRENQTFNDKVKDTWLWFMSNEYEGLEEDMAEFAQHVKAAAQADHKRWGAEEVPAGMYPIADNRDMDAKLQQVLGYLHNRIEWLKGVFGNYTAGNFNEPERDDSEAIELPDYAATGIYEITDSDFTGEREYYNLQGIRVNNPQPGQIYILRDSRSGATRKVIIR